jgi:hypothetical protein
MTRPILLVDGSNVAYGGGRRTQPILQYLLQVLDELQKFNFQLTVIVDAALRHSIDRSKDLEALINSGDILQAPAGRTADVFLLQLALKRQAKGEPVYILTNDMFPVKEAGGVIPRIAFMIAPIGEDMEIIFTPSLESLVEPVHEETSGPSQPEILPLPSGTGPKKLPEIHPELLKAFINYIMTLRPHPKEGALLAFAKVAGYLHNQFDGDFCNRFGYDRPKEFAKVLEDHGYVRLKREGTPLFLVLKPELFKVCKELDAEIYEQPPVVTSSVQPDGMETERIQKIIEALQQEAHYPTEEKIAIKLRSMFPRETLLARIVIDKGLESKYLIKEKLGNKTCYWPASGHWDAVDPDDPNNPYPAELWIAFKDALDRLPVSQRIAQTRYHLARNIGKIGDPSLNSLPQAKREHMVQLAVAENILNPVRTMMGIRINVPIRE